MLHNMDYNKPLNIVLIGDPEVGKTTLISKCHHFNPTSEDGGFFTREFKIPSSYKPTSLCSHLTSIYQTKYDRTIMYCVFRANIIDTGGDRRYDYVRPLAYMDADVFLVCFDISNRQSFLNVSSRWLPEVKKYQPKVPVILVGTKSDLKSRRQVTEAEAHVVSKTRDKYIETKSYGKHGMVKPLFDKAVEVAFMHRKDVKPRMWKSKTKNNETSFDITTLEKASDSPECPRGLSTLSNDWQLMLDSRRAADVILRFSDQSPEIHAHKFVLALASTAFRKLFKTMHNMCGTVERNRNVESVITDETFHCCKLGCANSENISTDQELDSNFLEKTPFIQAHCSHCSNKRTTDTKECKNEERFRSESVPIQITFKTCIKRSVFLWVLEWMYTGRSDISHKPEQNFIEDLQMILLELGIQALKIRLFEIWRQQCTIPIPPPLPPLLPSANGNNVGQHGGIPIPPPLPPLLPSANGNNVGQHGGIPIPPPLPPLLPSANGNNVGQHGGIPIPPPLPPLLPSANGNNVGQHGGIPIPPPLPPLLPSANGNNVGQHGGIPIPPPLPPLLPSANGNNVGQHGSIPISPPLPPLLPSVRGHNQPNAVPWLIPIPLLPVLPSSDLPIPPPLPRPSVSSVCLWDNAQSLDLPTDLVLIVDDTPVHVHRVVLITRSSVMAAMLDGRFKERDFNEVRLPGLSLEHFRTLLEFLYTGTCTLDGANVKKIMELADMFDVPSLMERCEEYIIHTLSYNTVAGESLERQRDVVMDTVYLSKTFNARLLHKWCLHYVATNYDLFEQEDDFNAIWSQNEEYMESNRWPPRQYIQVLKQYKVSKSKLNERMLRKRSRTTKCCCSIM